MTTPFPDTPYGLLPLPLRRFDAAEQPRSTKDVMKCSGKNATEYQPVWTQSNIYVQKTVTSRGNLDPTVHQTDNSVYPGNSRSARHIMKTLQIMGEGHDKLQGIEPQQPVWRDTGPWMTSNHPSQAVLGIMIAGILGRRVRLRELRKHGLSTKSTMATEIPAGPGWTQCL